MWVMEDCSVRTHGTETLCGFPSLILRGNYFRDTDHFVSTLSSEMGLPTGFPGGRASVERFQQLRVRWVSRPSCSEDSSALLGPQLSFQDSYKGGVSSLCPGPPCPSSLARPLTFIVVVLHGEDPALGSPGTLKNEFPVQGLDGERVQHANVDLLCEGRRCRDVLREMGCGSAL